MDYGPKNMAIEVRQAKVNNKSHHRVYRDQLRRMAGPYWDSQQGPRVDIENHYYQWVTNTLANSVATNPHNKIESPRGGIYKMRAEILQAFGDSWCEQFRLDEFLRRGPALDMNFGRGIAHVTLEKNYGYVPDIKDENAFEQPVTPCAKRIGQEDFVFDSVHPDPKDWLYCGHRKVWDKDELLEIAAEPGSGWDLAAVQQANAASMNRESDEARKRDGLFRDEIVTWELWCPKLKTKAAAGDDPTPDKGPERRGKYNGSVITLFDPEYHAAPEALPFPKKTRRYYGPECGPYALFDALNVPESGYPLSPLVATEGVNRAVNAVWEAMMLAIKAYKRGVTTKDKKLAAAIKDGPTDYVFHSGGLDGQTGNIVEEFEVGGPPEALAVSLELLKQALERNGGLTATRTGQTNTSSTATAEVLANAGAEARAALHNLAVERGTAALMYRVLWYGWDETEVAQLVGQVSAAQMAQVPPELADGDPNITFEHIDGTDQFNVWWRGGENDRDSFDSLKLSIEQYSMRRRGVATDEKQAEFLTVALPPVLQLYGAMPYVKAAAHLDMIGERVGIANLSGIIDVQALTGAQGLNVALQVEAGQPEAPDAPKAPNVKLAARGAPATEPNSPPKPTAGNGKAATVGPVAESKPSGGGKGGGK